MGFVAEYLFAAVERTVRLFESQPSQIVADLRIVEWMQCLAMAVERFEPEQDLQMLADSIASFLATQHHPNSKPYDLDSLSVKDMKLKLIDTDTK